MFVQPKKEQDAAEPIQFPPVNSNRVRQSNHSSKTGSLVGAAAADLMPQRSPNSMTNNLARIVTPTVYVPSRFSMQGGPPDMRSHHSAPMNVQRKPDATSPVSPRRNLGVGQQAQGSPSSRLTRKSTRKSMEFGPGIKALVRETLSKMDSPRSSSQIENVLPPAASKPSRAAVLPSDGTHWPDHQSPKRTFMARLKRFFTSCGPRSFTSHNG